MTHKSVIKDYIIVDMFLFLFLENIGFNFIDVLFSILGGMLVEADQFKVRKKKS